MEMKALYKNETWDKKKINGMQMGVHYKIQS